MRRLLAAGYMYHYIEKQPHAALATTTASSHFTQQWTSASEWITTTQNRPTLSWHAAGCQEAGSSSDVNVYFSVLVFLFGACEKISPSEMAAEISVAVTIKNQPMSGHPMWKDAIFGSVDITQQSMTNWPGEPVPVKRVFSKHFPWKHGFR